jgi:predicted  nucleic acid-binding Zn-ribbon protein
MPISSSLYQLQLLDTELARIRRERSNLDNGESLRTDVSTLQKAIAVEEEKLNQVNRARADKEDELKQREAKLTTQQTRLMNAKSTHEVASLQRDIDAITHSRGELDEAILTYMDEAESTVGKLDDLRSQLKEKGAELQAVETKFGEDAARLDCELKEVLAQREAAAGQLNEEETSQYGSSAKKHGGVAVTWKDKGNCHACGMMLTPYNLKEAKTEEWPTCESCGRLLFVE